MRETVGPLSEAADGTSAAFYLSVQTAPTFKARQGGPDDFPRHMSKLGVYPNGLLYRLLICMWSHFTVELLSKIGCRDIKYEAPHIVHVICSVRLLFLDLGGLRLSELCKVLWRN